MTTLICKSKTENTVYTLLAPMLLHMGYEMVRVRFYGGKKRGRLQLMIERTDGNAIAIEDCEVVSRNASVVLDVKDVISSTYNLEVSSPGIERPLTRLKDFVNSIGKQIKLQLEYPKNGRKNYSGILCDCKDMSIITLLLEDDTRIDIDFNVISDAYLNLNFKGY